MLFSASTGGFYAPSIHATMPVDVVEITSDQHSDLLAAQSAGAVIRSDHDGHPVAAFRVPSIADLRAAQAGVIEASYQAALAPVLADYSREEIDSWGVQRAEAYLLADDAAAPITLLPAIAAERGITVAALATLVIEKAAQYSQVAGAAFARRRNRLAAIAAAETAEAIAGITW